MNADNISNNNNNDNENDNQDNAIELNNQNNP